MNVKVGKQCVRGFFLIYVKILFFKNEQKIQLGVHDL